MSKKLIVNWSVGTDPELFLRSKETGDMVPSFYYIEGDKWNPQAIGEKDGFNIQCDNVMVEFGVPPSKTAEEFVSNNKFVLDYLEEKICKPNNLELVIFPTANFKPNELVSERAVAFGCSPDYNVYKNNEENTVGRPEDRTLRCAGMHLHIGYDNFTTEVSNLIIRAMDLFLSVPLILFEPDHLRKSMYGKAGAFRPQAWGVEYRVTSNYILSTPELQAWAFNQTIRAIEFINENHENLPRILKGNSLETIINNKNITACKRLVKKFDLVVVENKELVEI